MNKNFIINIGRQLGSGGRSIADILARHYGITAKQWLDKRTRQQLTTLAQTPHMTPQEMAAAMHCTPQKLNKLCQRYWGMAPGALIKNK